MCFCAGQGISSKTKKAENQMRNKSQWELHSATVRDSLNVPIDFHPWTSSPARRLVGLPQCARALDLLDCAFIDSGQQARKAAARAGLPEPTDADVARSLFVDVSQSVLRRPWRKGGLACLAQSACIYSFEADRILTPLDHFALQGFPASTLRTEGRSPAQLRSMAGEAFFLASFGAALYAYYLNDKAPWWSEQSR